MKGGVVVILALGACIQPRSIECARGDTTWVCPDSSVCDVVHAACVFPDQLQTCRGLTDNTSCAIEGTMPGICRDEVCVAPRCGDGFVHDLEQCDGTDLGAQPNCTDHEFYDSKPVQCAADCTYDTSACTGFCGDGVIDGAELCDGAPPGLSCVDLGYGAGALDCLRCGPGLADCKFLDWHAFTPASSQLTRVNGTSDQNVFVTDRRNQIYRNDGQGWLAVGDGCKVAGIATEYESVWALEGEGIAVGFDASPPFSAIVAHVTPNGCAREVIGANLGLVDVWASSATDIYAIGLGIHHWDGTSWTAINAATSYYRIWGSGPNDIYIGGSGGLVHGSGATWTPVTQPIVTVEAIWGTSPTDVYVAGEDAAALVEKIAHFDGSHWVLLPDRPATVLGGTSGARPMIADFFGAHAFDGTTWANLDVPATQPVVSIWESPTGSAVAITGGRIFSYSGGVESSAPLTGGSGVRIRARGPDDVYAATTFGVSVWNGTTWTADTDPSVPVNVVDLWPDPAGDVYAVQQFGAGSLYRRSSAGVWTALAATTNAAKVWGTAANDIWILDNGTKLAHWNGVGPNTTVCATCTAPSQLTGLWGSSSTDVFAVGDVGMILHWNGATWTAMNSNTTESLRDVFGTSPTDVFAVGYNGVVLHYDGVNWSQQIAPPGTDLFALWATSATDLFVFGQSGLRHFDGTRWSPVRTPGFGFPASITGAGDVMYTLDDQALAMRLIRTIAW